MNIWTENQFIVLISNSYKSNYKTKQHIKKTWISKAAFYDREHILIYIGKNIAVKPF